MLEAFNLKYEDKVKVEMTLDNISNQSKAINKNDLKMVKTTNIDVLSAIRTRRSIRQFSDKKIDDELINTILEAGFCAPTAENKRPWHFIVLKNKNTLESLSSKNKKIKALAQCDCCIIVCGDKVTQGVMELLIADCSAAMQNMLLSAHGLGLGAVWCGLYGAKEGLDTLVQTLKLPPKVIPIGMIAMGYPKEIKDSYERFEKEKVHLEKW